MLIEKLNKQNYKKIIANLRADKSHNDPELVESVRKIVDDIRKNGDKALFKYTKRYKK
jgi:histidinol dehydrogenase